jgi:Uma2 family endonuclease
MDTVLDRPWTVERFLAWEDRQEGKYEFDGLDITAMTGVSVAHQEIVAALRFLLARLLTGKPNRPLHEMRLRIGDRVRYPDVLITPGPVDQTARTLTDAVTIFEVLLDDTATTDRVLKLTEYADIPSLRTYVLLEQTVIGATVFRREPGQPWIATAQTDGTIELADLDIAVPLAALYEGLTFPS